MNIDRPGINGTDARDAKQGIQPEGVDQPNNRSKIETLRGFLKPPILGKIPDAWHKQLLNLRENLQKEGRYLIETITNRRIQQRVLSTTMAGIVSATNIAPQPSNFPQSTPPQHPKHEIIQAKQSGLGPILQAGAYTAQTEIASMNVTAPDTQIPVSKPENPDKISLRDPEKNTIYPGLPEYAKFKVHGWVQKQI